MRNLSQAEVEDLLRNYLAGVEVLRGMRGADRDRLNAKLKERLAAGTRGRLEVSTLSLYNISGFSWYTQCVMMG